MISKSRLVGRTKAIKCKRCEQVCRTVKGWAGCPKWIPDGVEPQQRLCDILDDATLNYAELREFKELQRIDRGVQLQVVWAHFFAPQNPLPDTPELFVQWVKKWHGKIFRGIPSIAGVLRDRAASFGGHIYDPHRRSGSSPESIEKDLFAAHNELSESLQRRDPIDLSIAIFLQRFFEVHPFKDGNGRVARVYCDCLAFSRNRQFVWVSGVEPAYTRGLEKAHAGRARDVIRKDEPNDPREHACLDELRVVVRALLAEQDAGEEDS